jgi:hypothetical protein
MIHVKTRWSNEDTTTFAGELEKAIQSRPLPKDLPVNVQVKIMKRAKSFVEYVETALRENQQYTETKQKGG